MRITKVVVKSGFDVAITFRDGSTKEMNLEPYLSGIIFEPLKDHRRFSKVRVGEGGCLAWPNGADICPDLLYYEGTPPWAKKFLKKHPTLTSIKR